MQNHSESIFCILFVCMHVIQFMLPHIKLYSVSFNCVPLSVWPRLLLLRRRCWGRRGSWKRPVRSWHRSDNNSTSSCQVNSEKMRTKTYTLASLWSSCPPFDFCLQSADGFLFDLQCSPYNTYETDEGLLN